VTFADKFILGYALSQCLMTVFSFLLILQALCLAQAEGMGQISKQAGFWGAGSKYADKWHDLEVFYFAGSCPTGF
jgi:ABC-type Fe3+-siderophore transport system permease subunit